jgi:hypothetical protein
MAELRPEQEELIMSTKTDARQPTVREWLATRPFRGEANARAYFGFRPTRRQLDVLDRAARRGYLYDPDPEPGDFPRLGRWYGVWRNGDARCWPYRNAPDADDFSPARLWWLDLGHGAEWEARCEAAGRGWLPREWEEAAPVPRHYRVWADFCYYVLGRPSVTAGRFIPEHWHEDTLGVRVYNNHAGDYRPARRGWYEMVRLASAAALTHYPEEPWFYFDGNTLAIQVAAADAEALAAQLTDRLLEVLDIDEPGFDPDR